MFNNLSDFWSLLSVRQKRKGMLVFMLILIGIGFDVIGVGLVLPLISLLTQNNEMMTSPWLVTLFTMLGNINRENLLLWLLVFMVGFYFVKNIYLIFVLYLQSHYTIRLGQLVANRLFELYMKQPYTFHLQRNSAVLIRNIVNEARAFGTLSMSLLTLVSEVLIVLGLSAMLLYISSWIVFLSMMLLGFGGVLFYKFIKSKTENWGKERLYHEGMRIQQVQQGIGGVKETKILGRESEFINRFSKHNNLYSRFLRNYRVANQLPRLWNEWVAVIGLLTVAGLSLVQGKEWSSILPMVGLFAAATFRLTPSVNRILISLQTIHYNFSVIQVIKEELDLKPADELIQKIDHTLNFEKFIELKSLCYHYPESKQLVLKNVNFKINNGQIVGFIGVSGSGKSTLIDIILGLLVPSSGEVLVDGINIQTTLSSWQSKIGYVPQSVYLTDESLTNNVAFGVSDKEIDRTAVLRAIRCAQLDDFVNELPHGLDTMIGENGVRLSGGQRQRIGIARALYHNPQVLVFDEATSALDPETELEVMNTIQNLKGERTILIIAHRLNTIEGCDVVYKVSESQVSKIEPRAAAIG